MSLLETSYICSHLPAIVGTIRKVHSSSLLLLGPAEASDWAVYVAFLWLQTHSGQTQKPMGTKSLLQIVFSVKLCVIKRSSLILMLYFFSTPFQQFLSWQKRNTHAKESFFSRPCICFHGGIQSCHACSDYWCGIGKCCSVTTLSLLCCYCMTSDLHLTFHPARCQRRGRRISLQEGIKTKDWPFLVITVDISLWFMPLPCKFSHFHICANARWSMATVKF